MVISEVYLLSDFVLMKSLLRESLAGWVTDRYSFRTQFNSATDRLCIYPAVYYPRIVSQNASVKTYDLQCNYIHPM